METISGNKRTRKIEEKRANKEKYNIDTKTTNGDEKNKKIKK